VADGIPREITFDAGYLGEPGEQKFSDFDPHGLP
jgi:hypothetical protein